MSGWMRHAACRHLTPAEADRIFFPVAVLDGDVWQEARAMCGTCPVMEACRTAGETETAGMWGGVTPEERGVTEERAPLLGCGTNASWHRGCRCDDCWAAKRRYTREQMRRQRLKGHVA